MKKPYQQNHPPRKAITSLLLGFLGVMMFCSMLALVGGAYAADIPHDAVKYKRDLIRQSHHVWGLNAPVATFAAQIHQESAWRTDAKSHVGAQGLAQFMPATAKWIAGAYPDTLSDNEPYNPVWALRALVTYDKWLFDRTSAVNDCNHMAKVLSAYNGGLGWVYKDQSLTKRNGDDVSYWWNSVEKYNAGRSAANFKENRDYPQRILTRHEPSYVQAGWGKGSCYD
jgi:soluble lytic murein transglycosylase-like protein